MPTMQTPKRLAIRLLRVSERYTKTDMVYLASGGFWLTSGQGVASISAFILSILFANYVSPETYGIYKYMLSLGGLLVIPTLVGIPTALQRAIARGEDGAAKGAFRARLIGGGFAFFGGVLAAGWYFFNGNVEFGTALLIVAISTPLMEAYGMYDTVMQGKGMFRVSMQYFSISSILATATLALAIFFSDGNLLMLVGAYFGTWTLVRVICWHRTKKLLASTPEAIPGETVVYGVRLSIIGIVSAIANQIDKIILFQFLGPAQLAIYAFATAMPEQVRAALKSITPLALSRFSRRSAEEVRTNIHKKALLSMALVAPIIAVYIVTAPYIYRLLFPAYLEAIPYSQVFVLSILVVPLFLYSAAFQSQRAEKIIASSEISMNLLSIAMLFVLIPLYGIWGAIWARLITRYLGTALLSMLIRFLK